MFIHKIKMRLLAYVSPPHRGYELAHVAPGLGKHRQQPGRRPSRPRPENITINTTLKHYNYVS